MKQTKYTIKLDRGNKYTKTSWYPCDCCGKKCKATKDMWKVDHYDSINFVCSKKCIDFFILKDC